MHEKNKICQKKDMIRPESVVALRTYTEENTDGAADEAQDSAASTLGSTPLTRKRDVKNERKVSFNLRPCIKLVSMAILVIRARLKLRNVFT